MNLFHRGDDSTILISNQFKVRFTAPRRNFSRNDWPPLSVQTYNFFYQLYSSFARRKLICSPTNMYIHRHSCNEKERKKNLEDNTVDTVTPVRSRVRQPRDSARQVVRDWGASGSHRVRDDLTPLEAWSSRREGGKGIRVRFGFGFRVQAARR